MNTLSLTSMDFWSLSPLLIILAGALTLLLLESFVESWAKKGSVFVVLLTLLGAGTAAFFAPSSENQLLTPWLRFDSLSRFLTLFFLAIGVAVTFLSASFFQRFEVSQGEYYFLILAAIVGLILVGSSADFLTLFLGIETLSISLYILCCYMKNWKLSHEAAIKYFLLGSLAAAFLLYGIALIYGATGTTRFDLLAPAYQSLEGSARVLFLVGVVFITLAFAFEAAIVPFHVWAPDVYDGAPTPVTAFMSVGTKVGAFAAFLVVFVVSLPNFNSIWNQGIALLAYPTLIYANFVAIQQVQLRRFFAYSGISHAGFLLIPFASGSPEIIPAVVFYLMVYAVATLGCFAVLSFLDEGSEGVVLTDLKGLFRRNPFLASVFSLCLLTLAGIPPTVGFFAKLYIFKLAFQAGYYGLVIVALVTTILSAFYYLRLISLMFSQIPTEADSPKKAWSAALVGIVSFAAICIFSIFPAYLFDLFN